MHNGNFFLNYLKNPQYTFGFPAFASRRHNDALRSFNSFPKIEDAPVYHLSSGPWQFPLTSMPATSSTSAVMTPFAGYVPPRPDFMTPDFPLVNTLMPVPCLNPSQQRACTGPMGYYNPGAVHPFREYICQLPTSCPPPKCDRLSISHEAVDNPPSVPPAALNRFEELGQESSEENLTPDPFAHLRSVGRSSKFFNNIKAGEGM